MATENEHRADIRKALDLAAARRGISLATEARTVFVNRAIRHIYARFSVETNRDKEVRYAVSVAEDLVSNLFPLVEFRVNKSLSSDDVTNFISESTNCIYPYCRPTP